MDRDVMVDLHVALAWDAARRVFERRANELVSDTGDGVMTVHTHVGGFDVARDVRVTLGTAQAIDRNAVAVPVSWQAVDSPGRFPVTDGLFELSHLSDHPPMCGLAFVGKVSTPYGPLGGIGDALGGRRVVDDVLQAVLEEVASRLTRLVATEAAEATERASASTWSAPRFVRPT